MIDDLASFYANYWVETSRSPHVFLRWTCRWRRTSTTGVTIVIVLGVASLVPRHITPGNGMGLALVVTLLAVGCWLKLRVFAIAIRRYDKHSSGRDADSSRSL